MSGALRCFVALEPPQALRESIASHFAREGRGAPGIRWTAAAGLHLTLKFLGDVEPARLPELEAALAAAVAQHPPFTLELRGAGAFPTPQGPRVVWVGAGAGAAQAAALAGAVDAAAAAGGCAPEARPFAAHLTVGRVRTPPRDRAALPRLLAAVADRAWGSWVVRAAHLVRSELFPAGPIYSILREMSLPERLGQE
jgi:2'-5' RNA ligase